MPQLGHAAQPAGHRVMQLGRKHGDAGWSSPVARQAHNLKVRGSNPLPATNLFSSASIAYKRISEFSLCFRALPKRYGPLRRKTFSLQRIMRLDSAAL